MFASGRWASHKKPCFELCCHVFFGLYKVVLNSFIYAKRIQRLYNYKNRWKSPNLRLEYEVLLLLSWPSSCMLSFCLKHMHSGMPYSPGSTLPSASTRTDHRCMLTMYAMHGNDLITQFFIFCRIIILLRNGMMFLLSFFFLHKTQDVNYTV